MSEIKQLNEIKSKLEQAKNKRANIEGKISSKKEQLIALGFKDSKNILEDAENELVKLGTSIDKFTKQFTEMIEEFRGKYPTLFEE